MDSNARFKSSLGFIDLLFNILLGFAFLFIVAFLLIKPEAKKKDFDRRAEFVIILEWNHDAPDDLDLYVQDPMGDRVSFRLPRINYMHLDKDDLGKSSIQVYCKIKVTLSIYSVYSYISIEASKDGNSWNGSKPTRLISTSLSSSTLITSAKAMGTPKASSTSKKTTPATPTNIKSIVPRRPPR